MLRPVGNPSPQTWFRSNVALVAQTPKCLTSRRNSMRGWAVACTAVPPVAIAACGRSIPTTACAICDNCYYGRRHLECFGIIANNYDGYDVRACYSATACCCCCCCAGLLVVVVVAHAVVVVAHAVVVVILLSVPSGLTILKVLLFLYDCRRWTHSTLFL